MAFLDRVVFPAGLSRLVLCFDGVCFRQRLFCLNFLVLGLLLRGQIAVFFDKVGNTLGDLLPSEMNIRAISFLVVQSLSVMVLSTPGCAGQGMGAPTDTVLLSEKRHLLLVRMRLLKECEDTALAALKAAAAGHGGVDLVLGDKMFDRRNLRHIGCKFFSGQRQILQLFPNLSWSVVMEPKQVTVLVVRSPKGGIFIGQGLPEIRAFQLFGQPFGFLREPVSFNLCKATQIPCFPGLIAEIVVKIPKL